MLTDSPARKSRHSGAARFDDCRTHVGYLNGMDAEQTIAEIACIERIFAEPDTRRLSSSDLPAANRRHDEMQANSPWFQLWQPYGVCCRSEADARLQLLRSSTAFPSSSSISKSLRVPIRMWRPALTREA